MLTGKYFLTFRIGLLSPPSRSMDFFGLHDLEDADNKLSQNVGSYFPNNITPYPENPVSSLVFKSVIFAQSAIIFVLTVILSSIQVHGGGLCSELVLMFMYAIQCPDNDTMGFMCA